MVVYLQDKYFTVSCYRPVFILDYKILHIYNKSRVLLCDICIHNVLLLFANATFNQKIAYDINIYCNMANFVMKTEFLKNEEMISDRSKFVTLLYLHSMVISTGYSWILNIILLMKKKAAGPNHQLVNIVVVVFS